MPRTIVKATVLDPSPTSDDGSRITHVPAEVSKVLATLGIAEPAFKQNPIAAAKVLSTRGRSADLFIVRFLEKEAVQRVASSSPELTNFAIRLLIECSLFYHVVGRGLHGIALLEMALLEADRIADRNLQRRAHNSLGGFYATRCDFERSCKHLETSFYLAKELNNPVYVLASLANTVAALDTMGFLHDARDLALSLTSQPQGTEELDYLHLLNANNAIRICHALNDEESADIFFEISSKNIVANNPIISEVTRAHFESARATHLIAKGSPAVALAFINHAIEMGHSGKNTRTAVVLYCAQALAHVALHEEEEVERSKVILAELLSETKDSSDLQEELLKALIKLHSGNKTKPAKRQTLRYLRLLREHVVAVKFGHLLFNRHTNQYEAHKTAVVMEVPAYDIPQWILQAGYVASTGGIGGGDFSAVKSQLEAIESDILGATEEKSEIKLRTNPYRIAESWAVAAEFYAEGSGLHCFRVGKIAGLIAGQLDWSIRKCITLELACRLHDIGKLGMGLLQGGRRSLRSLEQFGIIHEHTALGEGLLSSSSDQTLKLAAKIARSHHEWWNGGGFPSGLRGTSISLESRICAVADAFVILLSPPAGQTAWSVERAFEQVTCMSGVQLDPEIVDALGKVVGQTAVVFRPNDKVPKHMVSRGQPTRTKRDLYDVLEIG